MTRQVQWHEVPDSEFDLLGHGFEFHSERPDEQSTTEGPPRALAFIEGFDWTREPSVVVEVQLNRAHGLSDDRVDELRSRVEEYVDGFAKPQAQEQPIGHDFFVHLNA